MTMSVFYNWWKNNPNANKHPFPIDFYLVRPKVTIKAASMVLAAGGENIYATWNPRIYSRTTPETSTNDTILHCHSGPIIIKPEAFLHVPYVQADGYEYGGGTRFATRRPHPESAVSVHRNRRDDIWIVPVFPYPEDTYFPAALNLIPDEPSLASFQGFHNIARTRKDINYCIGRNYADYSSCKAERTLGGQELGVQTSFKPTPVAYRAPTIYKWKDDKVRYLEGSGHVRNTSVNVVDVFQGRAHIDRPDEFMQYEPIFLSEPESADVCHVVWQLIPLLY